MEGFAGGEVGLSLYRGYQMSQNDAQPCLLLPIVYIKK